MATHEELEARFDALRAKMFAILDVEDAGKIIEIAEELKAEATDLEKDAKEWGAKMEGMSKSARGRFEVVLTPEQRTRIYKETGVEMETVFIDDQSGRLNAAMPGTRRLQIEKIALEQARAKALYAKAEEEARAAALNGLMDLENQGGQMADLVAMVMEDPQFRKALYLDKKP